MTQPDDLLRLRAEYARRHLQQEGKQHYSWVSPANLFTIQQRQRAMLRMLAGEGLTDLSELQILEMGCGDGGVLLEFISFGASPGRIAGLDFLYPRLQRAMRLVPHSPLVNADGSRMPFPDEAFDLVIQFTALSSILDSDLRRQVAQEMLRVLHPGGAILWYDFWWNPTNPQTRGIRPSEIRSLFPGCRIVMRRITLAPPIARRLVSLSWPLGLFLESIKIFNSHYLALVRPGAG